MNYKNLVLLLIFFLYSCSIDTTTVSKKVIKSGFKSNGFALIYDEKLYKNEIISSKLDSRRLLIFQRNLKKGSLVKITNNLNNKSIIVKVGKNAKYPTFNNSVITERIANEIEINLEEPYVEIAEILYNSLFVAKKAKTFDEEKQVADKPPIETISINDLNSNKKKIKKKKKRKFSYIIKIADFYFKDTAKIMIKRIKEETPAKKIKLRSVSENNYRVFLGPFNNLSSLKKTFNDIKVLDFENIEIIRND